jgi:ubiquinone/menaquinone biosynthesis C-methylase UbiE
MPETITFCPVCQSTQFQHYLDCIDYTVSKERFHLDECRNCHFIFTNPRPLASEIGKYYQSEDYISHSNSSVGIQNKLYKTARKFAIRGKLKLIDNLKVTNRNLLDYGCGTGEFLAAAGAAGWQVQGMEPDPGARNQAIQNLKLTVSAPEELRNLGSESVQVITLWHVLEHVHDLQETIQQFHRVLKRGGNLIIAVPNCDSSDAKSYGAAWAAYDVPRHLYHFTLPVMRRLMEANSFSLQSVSGMFFDPFYISLLSEKYRGGMNPIRAGWNGMITNLKGVVDVKNHSSLLYVFQKQ